MNRKQQRMLFYFAHPAQYLFLRETIRLLQKSGDQVIVVIKKKDVLEDLIKHDGLHYINILPKERGKTRFSIILSLLKRNLKLIPLILKFRPHLMIGTDASIAQLGWLFRIDRITITEDDYEVIKSLAKITYPFTNVILCPDVCKVGAWDKKKVGYLGYMKLGYLHPNVFVPDPKVLTKYQINSKFVLIRLAKLTAHHDFGIAGINEYLLDRLITEISKAGYTIFISSEGDISDKYIPYVFKIDPCDLHTILSHTSLLISDSQSMSVEASMLGVPSIRLNDFVGRISVLEELEHRYGLTYGIKPADENLVFEKLKGLLRKSDLKKEFQSRRKKMLDEKIDVSAFLFWFIKNYPESLLKANDFDFQRTFK